MFTELWLIRHGETEWTAQGLHNGRTDIPLNARGRAQAAAARDALPRRLDVAFSSPLARARETAEICAFPGQLTIAGGLLEWDYGAFEGRTALDIRREIPGWTPWTHGFPAGETLADVAARAENFFREEIAPRKGRVAVFAHGHILRLLAACVLDLPQESAARLALEPGALSLLDREYERPTIRFWNLTPSPGITHPGCSRSRAEALGSSPADC
jgi:probable phosphoglycerate mutase